MFKTARYNLLIQQYKNRIYSYSLYMLKNKMDADDVSQEVFIRIWKNDDKFNILSAKVWIMKTTHNLCIDYLRKRKKTVNKVYSIDENFADCHPDENSSNDPGDAAHYRMMKDNLKEIIKSLPDKLRSVLVLYELEGMKYREISKALNIPLNSVKVYLLRARKQLQKELKIYEPEEIL